MTPSTIPDGIAVIGLSCRFPGAGTPNEFWKNLTRGIESITEFSPKELEEAGVPPTVYRRKDYVKKGFVIPDEDRFDAAFFGYSPREAELMDPQHRLLLESAWAALEDGGYPPENHEGSIGIFAGAKLSTYLFRLMDYRDAARNITSDYQALIGNDKDYLTTRISYKLNLKGPSVSVQSACSTSLVAVHFACENLLSGACDMALAGGVSLLVPQRAGYTYQEGMMLSPDGHCRAFDADARGMAPGNGVGMVLLKRLDEALEDGDLIHAVIRGTAVNNDGSRKTGYTTPSVEGQAKVIREAIALSDISPDSISYMETHGTGTPLGDPIEIEAASQVFKSPATPPRHCALGSVKTNIGHLDTAAGIAGFIKTVLCLKHGYLVPSLNFNAPNPKIDFDGSPFYVNTEFKPWDTGDGPRRAGVSSFGFGGTNAHVILEQPPLPPAMERHYPIQILPLSAKGPGRLKVQLRNFLDFLESSPESALDHICYTAQVGRSHFSHRCAIAAGSVEKMRLGLEAALEAHSSEGVFTGSESSRQRILFSKDASLPDTIHPEQETVEFPRLTGDMSRDSKPAKLLAQLYANGASIDWPHLYPQGKLRRIPLPTYPFKPTRHWVDDAHGKSAVANGAGSDMGYQLQWEQTQWTDAPLTQGSWIIPMDNKGWGDRLARQLENLGHSCVKIPSRDADPTPYTQLLENIKKDGFPPCCGIFHLHGLDMDADGSPGQGIAAPTRLFHLARWMGTDPGAQGIRLCIVTRGAQAVTPTQSQVDPFQSTLWGMGKVIGVEHPEFNCLQIDLDPEPCKDEIPAVISQLGATPGTGAMALRGEGVWVPRLCRMAASTSTPLSLKSDATYIITGGMGALGLEVAKTMAQNGAGHLLLVGRSAPGKKVLRQLDQLENTGCKVTIRQADITDMEQVTPLFQTGSKVAGIVHAAGVMRPGAALIHEGIDPFQRVTAPKIQGAWNLHRAGGDLDFFICFSSVASLWGIHGMISYTAGNAFLDGLAHFRQSRGLPALSINWGPWARIGAVARHQLEDRLTLQGIGTLTPEAAIHELNRLFSHVQPQVGIINADWNKLAALQPTAHGADFFTHLTDTTTTNESTAPDLEQILNCRGTRRQERITRFFTSRIARILGLDPTLLSPETDLMQLGMDSLIFMELAQVTETRLKVKIPPRIFVGTPTIKALEEFTRGILETRNPDTTDSPFVIQPDPSHRYRPFELTDIQHAYWVGRSGVAQLGDVACHVYFEIETTDLDLDRYTAAWQRVIDRHDMLRAIVNADGRQQVLKQVPDFAVEVEDLSRASQEDCQASLSRIRRTMSHQVRQADTWPLFEVKASCSPTQTILHIGIDLLIADGFSIYTLMQEIFQYYQDPELTRPELTCSFRDYVLAEQAHRSTPAHERAKQYWMDRLDTLPPAPELPLATSPDGIKHTRFKRRQAHLDAGTWQKLQNMGKEFGLTQSNLLLAAYAEVLGTWSRAREFTLNLTFFNRLQGHPQINEIIGDFTSLILLQVTMDHTISFKQRGRNIQARLWEDMEHRHFSGVRVLQELSRRRQGNTPVTMPLVFTSNLGYQNIHRDPGLALPGTLLYNITQTPQVWLDNQISETKGQLVIIWDAVEELFPPQMLDQMFQAYVALLQELAHTPRIWEDKIPNPTSTDKALIPPSPVAFEQSDHLLQTLFFDQAQQTPDQPAVICPDKELSYRELSDYAQFMGHQLSHAGVQPNTLVAIVMEKGWEQIVAALAVLTSGAAYLPIDPKVPHQRLAYLLDNGGVEWVITQSALEKNLKWPGHIKTLCPDTLDSSQQCPDLPSSRPQGPRDLAYVIYTSGSTGNPKGVMIDHRGAVNTILDINNRFNIGTRDRVFALSALNFDLSVFDIFGTLAAGGTIVMPSPDGIKDPAHWLDLMQTHGVTVWNSVPALMQMLAEHARGTHAVLPQELRLAMLSGDWIPLDLPDQIRDLASAVDIVSLGGATEASIWSILYPIETIDPQWKSIPYGKAMDNQEIWVLDKNLAPCPDWVTGQIYIGGRGLARGYWQDEEKTKKAFITHPETDRPLYRTGDLGRCLPDGNIEFLGREDFQVKLNGYRIELGEIETTLKQVPGISDAVVVIIKDPQGISHLTAHLVPGNTPPRKTSKIKQEVSIRLPDYMVPDLYLFHETFPVTANGKIDRKSLSSPKGISFSTTVDEYTPPANETENRIAGVVKALLDLDQFSTKTSFFDLGATSMHLVRLQNKLAELFPNKLSIVDIFENPTIAALATFITKGNNDDAVTSRVLKRVETRTHRQRQRIRETN